MWLYGVVALSLIVDQITKFIATQNLSHHSSVAVIQNIFHFTFVQNTGVAFGIMNDYGHVLRLVITVCVIVLLGVSYTFRHAPKNQQFAFGLIMGGALGNWIDRLRLGYVIDFLDFRVWPVFNVADSCITTGICLFIWIQLTHKSKPHAS